MKTLDLNDANESLAHYARDMQAEPVILTEYGKPIAALIPMAKTDWESISLSMNPEFLALIEQSRAQARTEGGLSDEEVRRKLGLADA